MTFRLVTGANGRRSEPVRAADVHLGMYTGLFALLCAAYLPEGGSATLEITKDLVSA